MTPNFINVHLQEKNVKEEHLLEEIFTEVTNILGRILTILRPCCPIELPMVMEIFYACAVQQ